MTVPRGIETRAIDDAPDSRFISRDSCATLLARARSVAIGGGDTFLFLEGRWTGNVRWARNRIVSSGDVRDNEILVGRELRGAEARAYTNRVDDAHIDSAVRHAERYMQLRQQYSETDLRTTYMETYPKPKIWSDTTYKQTAAERAELMQQLSAPATKAGMLSAGYLQVSGHGRSSVDRERLWYYPYTLAQYTVTVRDAQGQASGWAGADHSDWSAINAESLSAIALDKCLRSRNPVRAEPGRYTVILEPQAVCDFVSLLFTPELLNRVSAEQGLGPYAKANNLSKLGERLIDERLTVSMDSMDPALGFPPFFYWGVFRPVTWIKDGVLNALSYGRDYAVQQLGLNTGGLGTLGSYRMSAKGQATSMDDMIATTKRGILVTRFSNIGMADFASLLLTGYTRDGTWLIENGKVSHPVKNFRFTESPLFALNQVEQIGAPQRVFSPGAGALTGYSPVIVPSLKVRDFNFSSLSDAV